MLSLHLEEYYIIPAVVGFFILFFGLISLFIKEKLFLSEALIAFIFGIIVGPVALNLFNPLKWDNYEGISLEFARFILAIQVMSVGVYLPKKVLWTELRSLLILILPIMCAAWLISAVIVYAFFPLSFLESLLVAACFTPTDPVLANSIAKGRFAELYIPGHIRDILTAESGANDGLGYPYLFLAIYLLKYTSTSEAIGNWFGLIWGYQILLSIAVGIVVGYIAKFLLKFAETRGLVDKESFLVFWIALALLLTGTMAILGSDEIFACFIAGNVFTWDDWFRVKTEESHLQDVVDLIFNFSFFIYLGTIIPWTSFSSPELGIEPWRLLVVGILILLFRRIPAFLLAKPLIPALKSWPEAIFVGWFGPTGVGAIFYAFVAINELNSYEEKFKVIPYIFPIVVFMVICSIVVHGLTIPIFCIIKHFYPHNTSTISSDHTLNLSNLEPSQKAFNCEIYDDAFSSPSNPISSLLSVENNAINVFDVETLDLNSNLPQHQFKSSVKPPFTDDIEIKVMKNE